MRRTFRYEREVGETLLLDFVKVAAHVKAPFLILLNDLVDLLFGEIRYEASLRHLAAEDPVRASQVEVVVEIEPQELLLTNISGSANVQKRVSLKEAEPRFLSLVRLHIDAHHGYCNGQRDDEEILEQSHVHTEVSHDAEAEDHERVILASRPLRTLRFVQRVLVVVGFRGVFGFQSSFLLLLEIIRVFLLLFFLLGEPLLQHQCSISLDVVVAHFG